MGEDIKVGQSIIGGALAGVFSTIGLGMLIMGLSFLKQCHIATIFAGILLTCISIPFIAMPLLVGIASGNWIISMVAYCITIIIISCCFFGKRTPPVENRELPANPIENIPNNQPLQSNIDQHPRAQEIAFNQNQNAIHSNQQMPPPYPQYYVFQQHFQNQPYPNKLPPPYQHQ